MTSPTRAALATLTLLGACGGIDGGKLVNEAGADARLVVVNGSRATLAAITVSACSAMSHGRNRLPQRARLGPGDRYTVPVSAGCYDVQAGYAYGTGYAVADFSDIQVPAGGTYTLTVN